MRAVEAAEQDSRELALRIATVLTQGKAQDVTIFDVRTLTLLSDYFVIASGKTATQVKALARRLRERVRTSRRTHVEGEDLGLWVLMDYGDVIVHIFREPERSFYGLERLWGDAPRVEVPLDAAARLQAGHEATSDAHGTHLH